MAGVVAAKAGSDKPYRHGFKQFLVVWLTLPCQILTSGRQLVFRLLSYNAWVPVLLATVDLLLDLCLN